MNEKKKQKPRKPQRQEWKPNLLAQALYRAWMVVFGAAKIVLGALATVVIILAVCALAFATALGNYLTDEIIPNADMNLDEFTLDQTSFVYYTDSNGEIKLLQQIHTTTDRQWADFEDIPKQLVDATVAIEDKRFYEHQGVDWFTTIKAFANMFLGDDSKGGSTITQQLVKNLTQDDSVTVQRKLLEIFRATEMERKYDKDTIMEWYLNYIYMGHGCYGVRSAAEQYFGKELEMLTIAECASLISITNNPSVYDPYGDTWEYIDDETGELVVSTGSSRNNLRKSWTLGEMVTQGLISREEYEEAMAQELVFKSGIDEGDRLSTCLNPDCGYENITATFVYDSGSYYCPECGSLVTVQSDASQEVYSWFVDTVLEDVAMAMCERDGLDWTNSTRTMYMDMLARGGYHIYTTLDMEVQDQVDLIYEDLDEIPYTRSGQQLQSAIVVIDNTTGDIVAMSGGVGEKTVHDGWNIATDAVLQTGSSIKPLTVYAPAFETGAITPATVIKDLPIRYDEDDHKKPYPNNENLKYSYTRTVQTAVKNSINAVAAQVLQSIGAEFAYDFGKNEFGLVSLIDEYIDSWGTVHDDINVGALAMGSQTFGLTVREMSNAYATFANDGVYREARTFTKVFDSDGNLVLENEQDSRTILSKKTVDYMNSCLFEAAYRGTGTEADIDSQYVYGKTGTTNDAKDKWFCGFTKHYTAAVWTGYNDPEQIRPLYVNNPAAVLWNKVMEPVHEGLDMVRLYDNSDFVTQTICLDSGLLATDACKADYRADDDCSRIDEVRVYREDRIKDSCDVHVMMEICPESGFVANEWCQHFASEAYTDEATRLKLEQKGLCKITEEDLEEMMWTAPHGLWEEFLQDGWVYLVDERGRDVNDYHGLEYKGRKYAADEPRVNENVESPYAVCQVHTQELWEAYLATQTPSVDPSDPGSATDPTTPTDPAGGSGSVG